MLDNLVTNLSRLIPAKWRWIFQHAGFKRYFANTSWMFFGQVFSLILSFFIGAWLARYLGPENYGVLSYSIAFVGLFGFISSLGIDGIISRELINFPEMRDELLGTAFSLKLIGGVTAFLLAVIAAILFATDPLIKILIILLSFSFVLQAINIVSIYFQTAVKSKNNVKVLIFATTVSSLLKIAVILLDKGVIWIVSVFVLDSLWQGIGFIRIYKKVGLKIREWKFNSVLAKKILNNSWPLMLASAFGFIYFKIDQVMIGFMMGNYEVGLYAAAVKLVEIWYFVPGIICASLFPAIINAKKTSLELYNRRLKKFYILMTIIPVLMALPITILAKPIISTVFGSGYLWSVNILRIYIWSSLGLFLGLAVNQYLISENLVKTIFWLNFLTMMVNVILNIFFIPAFGLLGAAWATLISYMIVPAGVLVINKFKL